jgi:CubicO group peptidase (beta-lactamase class C family)
MNYALNLIVACTLAGCQVLDTSPHFSAVGPDADEYGAQRGYPVTAIYHTRFLVGYLSHQDQLLESRLVPRAATPSRFNRTAVEPAITYRFDRQDLTLDDYLRRNPATGLLIAQGDTIVAERYQYARNDRHRFTSFSMAKTVTAMLVGIAIAEGRIRSVDDTAEVYVPALAGTEYGRTSLRHLLQMSSGVRFEENYSGSDDSQRLWLDTGIQQGAGGVAAVKKFNDRSRWAGAVFSYASSETQVLGLVVAQAVGRPLADYLHEKIWQPMGAEADATWIIDAAGQEAAFCCINAVLRDYARLALLLAHDGRVGDRQLIPKAWLLEATTVAADRPDLRLTWVEPRFGYGYQTWILDDERRMFALVGLHGQVILVDPASRLVLVQTAVRKSAIDANKETLALWQGIVKQLGGRGR